MDWCSLDFLLVSYHYSAVLLDLILYIHFSGQLVCSAVRIPLVLQPFPSVVVSTSFWPEPTAVMRVQDHNSTRMSSTWRRKLQNAWAYVQQRAHRPCRFRRRCQWEQRRSLARKLKVSSQCKLCPWMDRWRGRRRLADLSSYPCRKHGNCGGTWRNTVIGTSMCDSFYFGAVFLPWKF